MEAEAPLPDDGIGLGAGPSRVRESAGRQEAAAKALQPLHALGIVVIRRDDSRPRYIPERHSAVLCPRDVHAAPGEDRIAEPRPGSDIDGLDSLGESAQESAVP
jgi:hypothetical protein